MVVNRELIETIDKSKALKFSLVDNIEDIVIKSRILGIKADKIEEGVCVLEDETKIEILSMYKLPLENTDSLMEYATFQDTQFTSIDISQLDTSALTSMNGLFYDSKAREIILGNIDVKNVKVMREAFADTVVNKIDLSKLDFSSLEDMNCAFSSSKAREIILSEKSTPRLQDISGSFICCDNLQKLHLNALNTSKVTNMSYAFSLINLKQLDLSKLDLSSVVYINGMFQGSTIDKLKLNFNCVYEGANLSEMFYAFKTTDLDLRGLRLGRNVSMEQMFCKCEANEINLSDLCVEHSTLRYGIFKESKINALILEDKTLIDEARHLGIKVV